MTSPQLPAFLNKPTHTTHRHATHHRRKLDRSNLYLFIFFTTIFAVIVAHAR